MKLQTVTFKVFEVGDYVVTPSGFGIICGIVLYVSNANDLYYQVYVQHKCGYSANPSNEVVEMDGHTPSLITKTEYDSEKVM